MSLRSYLEKLGKSSLFSNEYLDELIFMYNFNADDEMYSADQIVTLLNLINLIPPDKRIYGGSLLTYPIADAIIASHIAGNFFLNYLIIR